MERQTTTKEKEKSLEAMMLSMFKLSELDSVYITFRVTEAGIKFKGCINDEEGEEEYCDAPAAPPRDRPAALSYPSYSDYLG